MAENKKALIRYLVYDNCLNNKRRKYTYKDLIHHANKALALHDLKPIGKSQFYKDIEFMRYGHWKAPIETYNIGRNKYYIYTEDFSIQNVFAQSDYQQYLEQFYDLALELSPFKNMPWYRKMLAMNQDFNLEKKNIISFDFNELYKGQEFLEIILPAILNKESLTIQYKNKESYIVFPYYIRMYNNRFYLLAGIGAENTIFTFSLHHITAIESNNNFFNYNVDINWKEYFENLIGLRKENTESIEDVSLLVSANDLEYFKTKPLDSSQNCFFVEGDMAIVNIKVTCNIFLENLLLSYCDRIEILKPNHLRNKISYRLSKALSLYNS